MSSTTTSGEAVRIHVIRHCNVDGTSQCCKFSVDPQLTSISVLHNLVARAFKLSRDFETSYLARDERLPEAVWLPLLSDFDLELAFSRSSEPHLLVKVDLGRSGSASSAGSWELVPRLPHLSSVAANNYSTKLPGIFKEKMEKTLGLMQRALNWPDDITGASGDGRDHITEIAPLDDVKFQTFLDNVGVLVKVQELRKTIYLAGLEPSLRKVVWKHLLDVYPAGLSGKERLDYMKEKTQEYRNLRDRWQQHRAEAEQVCEEVETMSNMVRKDVLRTDRQHPYFSGSDDNPNTTALFNILTTYSLNHPSVGYCQGMSDLASPLLVTQRDEAHAYVCFCALMSRIHPNFHIDGVAMSLKFQHLTEALIFYDPNFFLYLQEHQADDLLFCYRWLLLELKREFVFEDAQLMLEVLWSSLPPRPPHQSLRLAEVSFDPSAVVRAAKNAVVASEVLEATTPALATARLLSRVRSLQRVSNYKRVCDLRRQRSTEAAYFGRTRNSKRLTRTASQPATTITDTINDGGVSGDNNKSEIDSSTGGICKDDKNKRVTGGNDDNKESSNESQDFSYVHSHSRSPALTPDNEQSLTNATNMDSCTGNENGKDYTRGSLKSENGSSSTHDANINFKSSNDQLSGRDCVTITSQSRNFAKNSLGNSTSSDEVFIGGPVELAQESVELNMTPTRKIKNLKEFMELGRSSKCSSRSEKDSPLNSPSHHSTISPNKSAAATKDSGGSKSSPKTSPLANSLKHSCSNHIPSVPNSSNSASNANFMTGKSTNDSLCYSKNSTHSAGITNAAQCTSSSSSLCNSNLSSPKHSSRLQSSQCNHTDQSVSTTATAVISASCSCSATSEVRMNACISCSMESHSCATEDGISPLHGSRDCCSVGGSSCSSVLCTNEASRRCFSESDAFLGGALDVDAAGDEEELCVEVWENPVASSPVHGPCVTLRPSTASRPSIPNSHTDGDVARMLKDNQTLASKTALKASPGHQVSPSTDKANSSVGWTVGVGGQHRGSLPPPPEFGGGNPFLMIVCVTILLQHRDSILSQQLDHNDLAMHFDKLMRKHDVHSVLREARQRYRHYCSLSLGKCNAGEQC